MKYNEKLAAFFKSKRISQKNVAEIVGFAPAMISRYLSGTSVFPPEFLISLTKHFPEIDLQYIFSEDDKDIVSKQIKEYNMSLDEIIEELNQMERKIAKIRMTLQNNF